MTQLSYQLAEGIGYLKTREVTFLKEITRRLPKEALIVNIGIGAATSILAMYEERPELEIVGVDINPDNGVAQLMQANITQKVSRIIGDSKVIGREWARPIHLLFVDGDHEVEGVTGDIQTWVPHVASNGIVLFHDYDSQVWPDVQRTVDELMAGWHEVGCVETLLALSKFDTYWLEV